MSPPLFCMPMKTILRNFRTHSEPEGAEASAYMNDIAIFCLDTDPNMFKGDPVSQGGVATGGCHPRRDETVDLPPMGHMPTSREKALLVEMRVTTTKEGGDAVIGTPVCIEALVRARVETVVTDNGAECLARVLTGMSNRPAASRSGEK